MPTTKGLVQRLKVTSVYTFAYIGPNPSNTQLLLVRAPPGASAEQITVTASQVEVLATALVTHQEVSVTHGGTTSRITSLVLEQ